MRLSSLLGLGLIAFGAAASLKTLRRRHEWEQSNQRTYIVLDYDDALAVSTRAGMRLPEFLREAHHHGATHVSLPELTLDRLMREGRIVPTIPANPIAGPPRADPPAGRWVYLAGTEPDLLEHLACELAARVPSSNAHLLPHLEDPKRARGAHTPIPPSRSTPLGHPHTLALSGHFPTLAEMGLGFEATVAADVLASGLGLVPRPVSFSWPEDHLVERTLTQSAGLGAEIVAFEGDLILGHEMHLETTVACLERLRLSFAYFCETRHQKGDWFVAKRLARRGQVILAHAFSPAAMAPEDFHSAAHHWGMLAHARGIRLCYVNVFRRIHATDPLECLRYLEHIRKNLDAFDGRSPIADQDTSPDRDTLARTGLASAGAVSLAAVRTLNLPEPMALALAAVWAAGAYALPYLDRPRGHLEEAYPPSYAPKLLALAAASAAPLAAAGPVTGVLVQMGVAAAVAALTSGRDYQLRIEEFRSLDLDWLLPLAGVAVRDLSDPKWKALVLAALGMGWYAVRSFAPDLLGRLDRDLPAGHTHHLSAAQRLMGDAMIAFGPRPGRKWAGLGLAGLSAAGALRRAGRTDLAVAASLLGVAGNALMLAAFRRPERPLAETLPAIGKSWGWGVALAVVAAHLLDQRPQAVTST